MNEQIGKKNPQMLIDTTKQEVERLIG